jgi:hypothetical protein
MNKSLAKNYWFWVAVILAVGVFFFYVPVPGSNKPARLTIKFEEGKVRAFEGPVEGDMTILKALLSASRGGGFDVRYYLDEDGNINLLSIDQSVNGPKKWSFYLNGGSVRTEDIDKVKIKKGDLIEAIYE